MNFYLKNFTSSLFIFKENQFYHLFFFFGLISIVLSMPFSIKINVFTIIFTTLFFLIIIIKRYYHTKNNKYLLLLFISYYLLQIIGLLYTDNLKMGFFKLEVTFTLLLFPLLFFFAPKLSKKGINILLVAFVCVITFQMFYAYGYFLNKFFTSTNINPWDLISHNFIKVLDIHTTYISIYVLFCLSILAYFHHSYRNSYIKAVIYFLSIILCLFLFLIASRISIIILGLSVIGYVLYLILKLQKIKLGLSILIIPVLSFFILFQYNYTFKERISSLMVEQAEGSMSQRLKLWNYTLNIIKTNPIIGVGTGDLKENLNYLYANDDVLANRYLNPHNQYLATAGMLGLSGLILLLMNLLLPQLLAIQQKKYLYFTFLFIISFTCLTETVLHLQKGVVFYSFFNSLLAFHFLEN